MGMLKPTPSLCPDPLAMAVLMPMTSPRRADERPAAIAWVDRRIGLHEVLKTVASYRRVSNSRRPLALMMPVVTDWLNPKGLPTATTASPISILSLSPMRAGIRSAAVTAITPHVTGVPRSDQMRVGVNLTAVGETDVDLI